MKRQLVGSKEGKLLYEEKDAIKRREMLHLHEEVEWAALEERGCHGMQYFQPTKLITRLTYTLEEIEGPLEVRADGSLKFEEKDGVIYVVAIVQLLGGERVPFLFTIKDLGATSKPDAFGGQFLILQKFLRFLPKPWWLTGVNAMDIPVRGACDEKELAKENGKDTSALNGKITFSVSKTNLETSREIGCG
ncbi:hypothetical protein L7F22_030322 [Adiantum nelumboides]|nr:hypothetical protein [Adiantum nelumboides]